MSDEQPRVELDWAAMWCARHLAPFRQGWPAGAAVAMVRLFGIAVADERIIAACPTLEGGKADANALTPVLREFGPICCFLGDEAIAPIYAEAGKEPPA